MTTEFEPTNKQARSGKASHGGPIRYSNSEELDDSSQNILRKDVGLLKGLVYSDTTDSGDVTSQNSLGLNAVHYQST